METSYQTLSNREKLEILSELEVKLLELVNKNNA